MLARQGSYPFDIFSPFKCHSLPPISLIKATTSVGVVLLGAFRYLGVPERVKGLTVDHITLPQI